MTNMIASKLSCLSFLLLLLVVPSVWCSSTAEMAASAKPNEVVEGDENKDATVANSDGSSSCAANQQENQDGTCQAEITPVNVSTTSPSSSAAATTANQTQTQQPSQHLDCGLYLAASSIPNAGWGMYTGVPIKEGSVIPPVDVVIPVVDHKLHQTLWAHYKRLENTLESTMAADYIIHSSNGKFYPPPKASRSANTTTTTTAINSHLEVKELPEWLMKQYYWDPGMTHNYYDAEQMDCVVPGLGMLANSHPGMVLAENLGPARPALIGGPDYTNAARTPYQDQSFEALMDIPAGHELFVEYGDDWFVERFHRSFGLSKDYFFGNKLAEKWQTTILDVYYDKHNNNNKSSDNNNNQKSNMWQDLTTLFLDAIATVNPRLHEVVSRLNLLPTEGDSLQPFRANANPTAYASVPSAPQSLEWLAEHGICLDHITVGNSTVAPGERGAFASRLLPKGTIVAPAPVVHMSRDHLTMFLMDKYDADMVLWRGHQLLLNYVYGHVESSLLFFPYAPAVNLINHYHPANSSKSNNSDDNINTKRRANVKLQWSSKMPHPEWLESPWTPDDIIEESEKAGLVMEIVALEDIPEGAEILLDYGSAWQEAFEEHAATTPPPPELPPVDWNAPELLTINDKQKYPSHVQTVCWVHPDQQPVAFYDLAQEQGHGQIPDRWVTWTNVKSDYLSDTLPCKVMGKTRDGAFYNVLVHDVIQVGGEDKPAKEVEVEIKLTNVPRRAITIVPMMYINAEHRRDAFRHEIQLPDEMVPENWRDLKVKDENDNNDFVQDQQCNLYMAESAIPNAGWGLYRGYATPLAPEATYELDRFCEDMVIHVEDFDMNQMLRNRYFGQEPDPEMDDWLLSMYAWAGEMTKGGNFEAQSVQSFAPGCGMLANSHPLLYNTHRLAPHRITTNATNPALGATTHYHSNLFVEQYLKKGWKVRTMQNGIEILVKYGDAYFKALDKLEGPVALREDYIRLDKVLRHFKALKNLYGEKAVGLLWKLLWNTIEVFNLERIASILPRDMSESSKVLEMGGSANYNLQERIKTPEWLEEHGSCADNIRPGTSTIELAGKGAFAARRIEKGKVIAPLPMIHVHRHHMDIYNSKNVFDPKEKVFWEGKQLILNYCYGHPESNLLLFPYSPGVNYINHAPSASNSTSDENAKIANAKLQWSQQFNTQEWLQKSPEELLQNHKRAGLVMEVVATRDIFPGEEIFLDYSAQWSEAWKNHTEKWKVRKDWDYEPPKNEWLEWVPTENEILDRNLHVQYDREDKFLGCHVKLPDLPNGRVDEETGDLPEFEWTAPDGLFRSTRDVFPCEILERHVEADSMQYAIIRKDSVLPLKELYTAVVSVPSKTDIDEESQQFISYNMPRRAIEIFDEEYAAPQFYRGAFRHEIGIPDDIFPDAWRDLKS